MPQTPYVLHVTAEHTAPEAPGTFGELAGPEHRLLADGHVTCAVCPAKVITDEETP